MTYWVLLQRGFQALTGPQKGEKHIKEILSTLPSRVCCSFCVVDSLCFNASLCDAHCWRGIHNKIDFEKHLRDAIFSATIAATLGRLGMYNAFGTDFCTFSSVAFSLHVQFGAILSYSKMSLVQLIRYYSASSPKVLKKKLKRATL